MRTGIIFSALAAAAAAALAMPAKAQYLAHWYDGAWRCTVGGASGSLVLGIGAGDPAIPNASCGPGCSLSEGGRYGGRFSTIGLANTFFNVQGASANALYLQGPQGILWYLDDLSAGPQQMAGRAGDGYGWAPVSCGRERFRPRPEARRP